VRRPRRAAGDGWRHSDSRAALISYWPITDHADPFFPGIGLGLFEGARGGTRGWGR